MRGRGGVMGRGIILLNEKCSVLERDVVLLSCSVRERDVDLGTGIVLRNGMAKLTHSSPRLAIGVPGPR